mmetsp:Transcript_16971/g.40217  ORF Transcript_16971/g.40217 Transcript_16971/m.40217 type:complete len:225 (+) Transcript_16971:621-1295(+)
MSAVVHLRRWRGRHMLLVKADGLLLRLKEGILSVILVEAIIALTGLLVAIAALLVGVKALLPEGLRQVVRAPEGGEGLRLLCAVHRLGLPTLGVRRRRGARPAIGATHLAPAFQGRARAVNLLSHLAGVGHRNRLVHVQSCAIVDLGLRALGLPCDGRRRAKRSIWAALALLAMRELVRAEHRAAHRAVALRFLFVLGGGIVTIRAPAGDLLGMCAGGAGVVGR